MGFEGGPRAKCASSLANAETISLAVAAASAGHKKGVKGTKAHRQCKRHHQTVGLTRRIVNAAERQNLRYFAVQRNADAHTRGRRSCFLNLARSLRQGRRIDGMRTGPAASAGDPARAAQTLRANTQSRQAGRVIADGPRLAGEPPACVSSLSRRGATASALGGPSYP